MSDARVPMSVVLDAFGVPITVTRPAPDDDPYTAVGVWLPELMDEVPIGAGFQRREPRRVLAVSLAAVPALPRGTIIDAPQLVDGYVQRWKVDAFDRLDGEHARVVVVPAPDAID